MHILALKMEFPINMCLLTNSFPSRNVSKFSVSPFHSILLFSIINDWQKDKTQFGNLLAPETNSSNKEISHQSSLSAIHIHSPFAKFMPFFHCEKVPPLFFSLKMIELTLGCFSYCFNTRLLLSFEK